jgi:hypothetical protein
LQHLPSRRTVRSAGCEPPTPAVSRRRRGRPASGVTPASLAKVGRMTQPVRRRPYDAPSDRHPGESREQEQEAEPLNRTPSGKREAGSRKQQAESWKRRAGNSMSPTARRRLFRPFRRACVECRVQPARFQYRGRVRADRDHTLCFRCFRAEVNRQRAQRLAASDSRRRDTSAFMRAESGTPVLRTHERTRAMSCRNVESHNFCDVPVDTPLSRLHYCRVHPRQSPGPRSRRAAPSV